MADEGAAAGPSRLRTPPPSNATRNGQPPPTPEHVRIMQENRLKAKARIQQHAAAQYPEARLNEHGKRPLGPVPLEQHAGPSSSTSASLRSVPPTVRNPTADQAQHQHALTGSFDASPRKRSDINPATGRPRLTPQGATSSDPNAPLPRDKSLGDYIEFDLSRLHNSKGGFLVDDDGHSGPGGSSNAPKTIEEVRKERERERERIRAAMEPGIVLSDWESLCVECGSRELNDDLRRVFAVKVCRACERKLPEKYSLLTKTEVKEDYLLTDAELRDEELLPHMLKANPHKSTYSNMMLFLRSQVEGYAFSPAKWGSEQGLDDEFERRQEEKSRKRGKKFAQGLRELRRRTAANEDVWRKRRNEEHRHVYVDVEEGEGDGAEGEGEDDGGLKKQVCQGCGHVIEVEVF